MSKFDAKLLSVFAGGILFGTAGLKALASRDAKKLYTNSVAAGLRVKDTVMDTITKVQENVEDIVAEAKEINNDREEIVVEFTEEEVVVETVETEETEA